MHQFTKAFTGPMSLGVSSYVQSTRAYYTWHIHITKAFTNRALSNKKQSLSSNKPHSVSAAFNHCFKQVTCTESPSGVLP